MKRNLAFIRWAAFAGLFSTLNPLPRRSRTNAGQPLFARLLLPGLLATLDPQLSTVLAQGTAFNVQGRLDANGATPTGLYDFLFGLYQSSSGGVPISATITNFAVGVTNGIFSTA